jgi:hypothetical protein
VTLSYAFSGVADVNLSEGPLQWVGTTSFASFPVTGTTSTTKKVAASAFAVLGKQQNVAVATAACVGICVQKDSGALDLGSNYASIREPPTGADGGFRRTVAVSRSLTLVGGSV